MFTKKTPILMVILTAVAGLAGTVAATASASSIKICVPKREGAPMLTPKHGKCHKGYKLATLGQEGQQGPTGSQGAAGHEGKAGPEGKAGLSASELETLKNVLPFVKYVAAGVGGKPTIEFTHVNVEVNNGLGMTASANGLGNLIVGYDETEGAEQTGSHNLVLGEDQTFTSFGGLIAGAGNKISGPFASVAGGFGNTAQGEGASISGGNQNFAGGSYGAWVGGGYQNGSEGSSTSVAGGTHNKAKGDNASILGGYGNAAPGEDSAVGGGSANKASGFSSSVSGGFLNEAFGNYSWVGGEKALTAELEFGAMF
jgi:hypothetical protein